MSSRRISIAIAAVLALASQRVAAAPPSTEVAIGCSRISPSMQTAVLEAVVYGGGPLSVDVVGWLCGRARSGPFVRIVMLRYPTRDEEGRPIGGGELVPVVFEDGRMVAHGWRLLEDEPERYGVVLPTHDEPWRVPDGWAVVKRDRELA
jgi:hypothetical protein